MQSRNGVKYEAEDKMEKDRQGKKKGMDAWGRFDRIFDWPDHPHSPCPYHRRQRAWFFRSGNGIVSCVKCGIQLRDFENSDAACQIPGKTGYVQERKKGIPQRLIFYRSEERRVGKECT